MQIIHRFRGAYPFGKEHEIGLTYVQMLKQNLNEQQIHSYKLKNKIMKQITSINVIKLTKIFKSESNVHFQYDYYPLSLEKYIDGVASQNNYKLQASKYKAIFNHFIQNIDNIIEILVHYQIKTDLLVSILAVQEEKQIPFIVKIFIDPDSDFLALHLHFNTDQHSQLKNKIQKNRSLLHEFYEAQKKKLILQFEELFETRFGKVPGEKKMPNFFINGSKLVFIKQTDQKGHREQKQHKQSLLMDKGDKKIEQLTNSDHKEARFDNIINPKKDLKDRNLKKMIQIKNNLNKIEQNRNVYLPNNSNDKNQAKQNFQDHEEVNFKPEEFTNDKTAILQEKQYLKCLEDQLEKINNHPKLPQQKSKQMPSQHRLTENRSRSPPSKNRKNVGQKLQNEPKPQQIKPIDKSNSRQQKIHKYKMKIITSHDIQIQGGGPEEIGEVHKEIVEGFNKGKLNMNEVNQIKSICDYKKQNNNCEQKQEITEDDDKMVKSRNSSNGNGNRIKVINDAREKPQIKYVASSSTSNSAIPHGQQHLPKHELHEQNQKNKNIVTEGESSENYYDKIKSAKSKAQQVLKQYAKTKKQ